MAKRQGKPNKKALPGRLRIVAGIWRSRLLDIASVPGLRPTSERVRETLFNWLEPHIDGARCLDLFAGTGALGLEALSRGASEAVFVESSPKAIAALRRNTGTLDARGARIVSGEATGFLERAGPQAFDIVFLDPPFDADLLGSVCAQLQQSGVLADGSLVYLEEDRSRQLPDLPAGWKVLKERTAGNVRYALATTGA